MTTRMTWRMFGRVTARKRCQALAPSILRRLVEFRRHRLQGGEEGDAPEGEAAPDGGGDHRGHRGRALPSQSMIPAVHAGLRQDEIDAAADRQEEQAPGEEGDEGGHRPGQQHEGAEHAAPADLLVEQQRRGRAR